MSSVIKTKDVANLSDVLTVLEPLETKWHKFGVHLRIQKEVLDRFENDYKGTERYLTEVISHWQKNNQPTWEKLASAVEKVGSHDNLVRDIRELAALEICSQESDADDNKESGYESSYDSRSDLFDTSSLSPGCGCGECNVHKMCTEGCPKPDHKKRLPILTKFNGRESSSETVTMRAPPASHGPAKRSADLFKRETEEMYLHFGNLITDTCESLIKNQKEKTKVALFLLNSFPILKKKADEINHAEDIASLLTVVTVQACSWFNFKIIKGLIKKFGDADDCKRMAEYEKHFERYAKQRLPQGMKHIELGSKEAMVGCKQLVVKVDREWESVSIAELERLCEEFARILGIEQKYLFLADVNEGCIMLTFMIPQTEFTSPSQTSFQTKMLAKENVVRLIFGRKIVWSRCTPSVQRTDSSSDEKEPQVREINTSPSLSSSPSGSPAPMLPTSGFNLSGYIPTLGEAAALKSMVIFEGYLHKTPPVRSFVMKWTKRWFVFSRTDPNDPSTVELSYYRDGSKKEKRQSINLFQLVGIRPNAKVGTNKHVFAIETKERSYVLKAPDQITKNIWLAKLCEHFGQELVYHITIPQQPGAIYSEAILKFSSPSNVTAVLPSNGKVILEVPFEIIRRMGCLNMYSTDVVWFETCKHSIPENFLFFTVPSGTEAAQKIVKELKAAIEIYTSVLLIMEESGGTELSFISREHYGCQKFSTTLRNRTLQSGLYGLTPKWESIEKCWRKGEPHPPQSGSGDVGVGGVSLEDWVLNKSMREVSTASMKAPPTRKLTLDEFRHASVTSFEQMPSSIDGLC